MLTQPLLLPEYTVTELSLALKKVVETGFSRVCVRGEISGLKRHTSGHVYFALKDPTAVIDGVCWRGTFQSLPVSLQEGLEVLAYGRLTTYPGRSKYQIVVDQIEAAGEGALLKLLEERKKKLAAEGLFEESRKKPLPFLPQRIGVITSLTGAVIRDILHRLSDRFPVHVVIWPVAVQGEGASIQVTRAIRGFQEMAEWPDLLIVARGGGSLEDLWAFNEEEVVRAVAESHIPVISAIGHETDITLVDFAADKRAPTPTAAAEMAVPLRSHLAQTLTQYKMRLGGRMNHTLSLYESQLDALRRGMPPLKVWLEDQGQRLDDYYERLIQLGKRLFEGKALTLDYLIQRLTPTVQAILQRKTHTYETWAQLLESYSYARTLQRGFAFVTTGDQTLISSKTQVVAGQTLEVHFHDGAVTADVVGK